MPEGFGSIHICVVKCDMVPAKAITSTRYVVCVFESLPLIKEVDDEAARTAMFDAFWVKIKKIAESEEAVEENEGIFQGSISE